MFARHLCTFESIHNFQLHSPLGAWGELFVNTTKDRNSPTNVGAIPVYQDFLVIEQMSVREYYYKYIRIVRN